MCARDRLRDFNLVCLKCGDVFQCAPNNMTRTGNRHIKSKHGNLKCVAQTVPFYKQRNLNDPPLPVGAELDPSTTPLAPPHHHQSLHQPHHLLDNVSMALADMIPLSSATLSKVKTKYVRCNDIDRRRLDRYVSSLIARCGLPSDLADHPVFKEFVEELTNNEYVPGDAVLVEKEQDRMYTNLMEDLKMDFERQSPQTYFTMSADIWNFRSDLSIVVMNSYCIDSRWRHLKCTAGVRAVPTDKVAAVSFVI